MQLSGTIGRSIHPDIAALARYCDELSGDEHLPRRNRFRPPRIGALLGYFFLIDVLHAEKDYVFSLYGERIAVLVGGDKMKGRRLSELDNYEMRQSLRRTYDRVVASHLPLYMRGRYVWPNVAVDIERLLIPMADDNGKLSTICGISIPTVPDSEMELYVGRGPARLVCDEELIVAA